MIYTSTERNWLSWLVKIRIIVLTFVLAIELLIVRLTTTRVPVKAFITLLLLWYTIAVFFAALVNLWDDIRFQSRLQIITDLLFSTGVVYLTGGIDTSFNFLYPLVIIVASILLPRWWSYFIAALSFIGFGSVLELSFFEVIPSYSVTRPDVNSLQQIRSLQLVIVINLFAFLLIAALSSNLVAKLRQVDSELQGTSGALLDLQALHANVIYSMRGGLITTDLEGRVTLLNRAGQDLLGRSLQSAAGRRVNEFFRDTLPRDTSIVHGEVRGVTPAGEERTFGMTVAPLETADRGLVGYIYTFDDLTAIRRLEHEVRMRDRLSAVGRMAAGIAHEIRNPLSSIAGSVKMLSGIAPLTEEQGMLIDIVNRESARLNNIVSDFLQYSREKNYRLARHNIVPLLEETLKLLENRPENASKYSVQRHFEASQAWVVLDPDRMKQVFWNICDNALRAMPDGGKLEVSVRSENESWLIAFRDHGPGISQHDRDKIFEPFQSSFEGGTGLGLAIVYQIVQGHKANVYVTSPADGGAEFVVRMPQASDETIAAQDAPPGTSVPTAGGVRG